MGCAWVHSRNSNSATKVSTQRLYLVSDVIAEYQTYTAMRAAADSYGGINQKAVYLNPTSVGSITTYGGGNTESGTSGSGSSSSGGGGNTETAGGATETVGQPTISGNTPFSESTSVTISGPDGAEIHYTTDGSEPSAESSLYSSALTLTETTTVKAIAVKDGVSSEVASKTFTKSSGNDEGGDAE